MIEIHVLSLTIGIVVGVMSVLSPSGLFNSFRPWRARVRPWPGRGGIPGKGFIDLKRVRLPSGAAATRQLRIAVEKRIPPQGGSALPRLPRPGCVASFNAYSGMWRGTPKQLAEWVLDGTIPLSSIDPSIRPNVEDICVEKYK